MSIARVTLRSITFWKMQYSKPLCLVSQSVTQVICVYASYTNFFQISNYPQREFEVDFRDYYNNLPSTQRRSESQRQQMIKNLIDGMGYSWDVLKLMLHRCEQHFQELSNIPSVKFAQFLKAIYNGFIQIKCERNRVKFFHCLTIKNGYLIDSIGGEVYLWDGNIKYYDSYEFVSAIDCDAYSDYHLQKEADKGVNVTVIDLT